MSLQPRIDPRAFRQVCQLEAREPGVDEDGQPNGPWRSMGDKFRADVHSVNGREFIAAAAMQAGATHTIETYWQAMFDQWQQVVAMRVRVFGYGGAIDRVFDAKTCDNVDLMNRLCRMMAVEGLKK